MSNFTLNDEQLKFIKETAHNLETQDKRHTETPIFRIYEVIKVERREGCGEFKERLDYEGAEDHYCDYCKNILSYNDGDTSKLPSLDHEDCDCNYETDAVWTFDKELLPAQGGYDGVAFLTYEAAESYRKANDYHFNGGGEVYAESAFRNWELKGVIDLVKTLGAQL